MEIDFKRPLKCSVFALTLLPCLIGLAAGRLHRDQVYAHDDFESPAVVRPCAPTLVREDVSPGMLNKTGKAVYTAKSPIVIREEKLVAPTTDGVYFETAHRLDSLSVGGELVGAFVVEVGGCEKNLSLVASRQGESVCLNVRDDGKLVGSLSVDVAQLPADISMAVSVAGRFIVSVSSLVDSSVQETDGATSLFTGYPRELKVRWSLRPVADGAVAGVKVDEYVFATARDSSAAKIPWSIDREPTFDPVKAGWKMVFEDEFEGASVDWTNKWFMPYYDARSEERKTTYAQTDGKGHLKMKVDFNRADEKRGTEQLSGLEAGVETNQLGSISLYTAKTYGYGYYEAKLKFTCQNGFWSAFWLYGDGNTNPFVDGFEIDGFEDYYTRRRDKQGNPGLINDHNLHLRTGLGQSKSWNFSSSLPADFDAWHVMGIKWTPFEISYYMDGKLLKTRKPVGHSPFDTVTFDAFNHGACTAPIHAVLSCCIMHANWNKCWQDLEGCVFPTWFYVDYVRIWEYPDPPGASPIVRWNEQTLRAGSFASTGTVMRFSAEVARASSGASIKAAYLFDNGYLVASRTEPPYDFELTMSEEVFSKSAYCKPGRQGVPIRFNGMPHTFHVYAQDENGRVGRTVEPLVRIPVFGGSSPFGGRPIRLPGKLSPAHFDEGGIPLGYYRHIAAVENPRQDLTPRPSCAFRPKEHAACSADGSAIDFALTGEWFNYTIEVAQAGVYEIEFPYGTPGHGTNRLDFFVDGYLTASAALEYHDGVGFERDRLATVRLKLPAGRHKLTLYPVGPLSFGTLTVRRQKTTGEAHE